MAVLKAKDVEKNLGKKGFQPELNNKHRKLFFYYKGKPTNVWTFTSHNGQEINNVLQSFMAKQLFLSNKEFFNLAVCVMDEAEYIAKLKERGKIN